MIVSVFMFYPCAKKVSGWTAEGYGEKIPTDWQVIIAGEKKWRKVYAICWSNVASHYIMLDGKREFIRDSDFPEPTDPSAQYVKA